MSRSSSGFGVVLALAVVAAAVCLSSAPAYGAGVQVTTLQPFFNADDVMRYNGGALTAPSVTYDNPTQLAADSWMVTQSTANQLSSSQNVLTPAPVGINDNGLYPANATQLYDVQLGFTNATPTGTNTVIQETTTGSGFTFNVPSNRYSQFAIFGSSGNGNTTLTITLNYSSGAPVVLNGVQLPDWYSGVPVSTAAGAAGTYFALTPAMSRNHQTAIYSTGGYQAPDAGGGAFIYGINLAPDSTRPLTSVTVLVTGLASPGSTKANFMAAAGAVAGGSPTPTPAPATLILLLAGLGLVYWFFVRRQHRAF